MNKNLGYFLERILRILFHILCVLQIINYSKTSYPFFRNKQHAQVTREIAHTYVFLLLKGLETRTPHSFLFHAAQNYNKYRKLALRCDM